MNRMKMSRIVALMLLDFRSLLAVIYVIVLPLLGLVLVSPSFYHSHGVGPWFFSLMVITVMIYQLLLFAEKNIQATLLATLPLTRDDIVNARYLFFVCILIIIMIPPLLLKLLFFPDNEYIYYYLAITFPILSFFAAVLYLVVFKSRSVITKYVIAIMLSSFIFGILGGYWRDIFALFGRIGPIILTIAGLLFLCLSYLLSLKFYRTRDL